MLRQRATLSAIAAAECYRNMESAPTQHFPQGPFNSSRLSEQHTPWPSRIARGQQYGPFALMQRTRHTVVRLSHHRIYNAVEQHLQFTRHIAPVARCTNNECIGMQYCLSDTMCIILRQYTLPRRTASHTPCARFNMQIAYKERLSFPSIGKSLRDISRHTRYRTTAMRRRIYYNNLFHGSSITPPNPRGLSQAVSAPRRQTPWAASTAPPWHSR